MGWGMLHASAGPGGGGGCWTDHYGAATTQIQEQQFASCSSQGQEVQQNGDAQQQQHEMYPDRCEEDLLASLLQVSDQMDESLASPQDTDGSSSCSEGFPRSSYSGVHSGMRLSSVEATRTHLIKEGLKLTIQSKRRERGQKDYTPDDDEFIDAEGLLGNFCELTEEDEERRRRRRERNKVAATKCRNKKKERTQRLAVESNSLESSNHSLKEEIRRLEVERQGLMDLLKNHRPACPMGMVQPMHPLHMHYNGMH